MMEINVSRVTKCYGSKRILNDINLEVKENDRIALIGSNGCGKTTLLKIIAGIENIDSGTLSIRKGASIGVLTQLPDYSNELVKDILYKGLEKELSLKEKLESYEVKLANTTDNNLDKIIRVYTKLQEEFISIGGYELNTRISKILDVFSINKDMLERKMISLSGGEKTIINLASIILSRPNILLLDEPTNYLDIKRIEWLEEFLNKYNGSLVVVSHDRYFLDKVTTKTILVEQEQLEVFHGNYSYFLEENENRIMLEFKNYKNQQKEIAAIKAAIKKLREWGKIGDNERFFKRANAMEKRLEKMTLLTRPVESKKLPIVFDMNNRSGKDVIVIRNLNIAYADKVIFTKVSVDIKYGEKVCIIGANGSGKTTLIREIINNSNESIKIGSSVTIGYISQELNFEDDNLTILDEARKYFNGYEQHLRSALCKFLFFGENIYRKIKYLSGGEKVRLKLFCLIQNEYNLLILDEPTNHIDIDAKEILENALQDFKGTVLFISHDRYFINKIADKILSIENNKLVTYIGGYDDYKKRG